MSEIQRSPRLVKRGDVLTGIVTATGDEVEDVVREVQITVVLANGQTALLPLDQNVTVLLDESINEELIEQIEAMQDMVDESPEQKQKVAAETAHEPSPPKPKGDKGKTKDA